jgi:lipopolysaccharide/colanic/teichoic acid biosynthesis glycosyltransferase
MGDNRTNNIVETRYGICVKPERISAAATAGFDYVELDLRYIQERSFWVDWKIIFKTIGAVIHKEGE